MYTHFFNLKHLPFRRTAHPPFLFLDENRKQILSLLKRTVSERGAAALLLGEPGTGKSTLLNALLENPGPLSPTLLINPLLSAEEFRASVFQNVFRRGFFPRDREEFLRTSGIYLERCADRGFPCLLIIDEAQDLSTELLEEIRLLLELKRRGNKLLSVLLAGLPQLAEKFENPECTGFFSHIRSCCELQPLDGEATRKYVFESLKSAGAESVEAIFSASVLTSIFRYSGGCPGMINTMADNAMLLAFIRERRPVDGSLVEEAYRDLLKTEPGKTAKARSLFRGMAMVFAFAAMLMLRHDPLTFGPVELRYPILPRHSFPIEEIRSADGVLYLPVRGVQGGLPSPVNKARENETARKPGPISANKAMQSTSKILEAHMCLSVVNRKPSGVGDVFDGAAGRVCCFTRVRGTYIDHVTHVWYYGKTEKARVHLPMKSDNWRTFSSKNISAEQTGEWHVDVVGPEGNTLARLDFQIR
jgi:general secretion pathway protein A